MCDCHSQDGGALPSAGVESDEAWSNVGHDPSSVRIRPLTYKLPAHGVPVGEGRQVFTLEAVGSIPTVSVRGRGVNRKVGL